MISTIVREIARLGRPAVGLARLNSWSSTAITSRPLHIACGSDLNLKRIRYKVRAVDLLKDGGENRKLTYLVVNPQGRVPALTLDDGRVLIQSLAILEYINERVPDPPFLPDDLVERARVRSVANIIACDIHPLNNSGTRN